MVGRHSRPVGTPARRRRDWADFDGQMTLAAGTTNFVDLLASYRAITGGGTAGVTAGPVHMTMAHQYTLPLAGASVRMGIIVAPQVVPTPADWAPGGKPGLDWMATWREYARFSAATVDLMHQTERHWMTSRRVTDPQLSLSLFVTNNSSVAYTLFVHTRTLVLLP